MKAQEVVWTQVFLMASGESFGTYTARIVTKFQWIQSFSHIHVYIKRPYNTRQLWLHWNWQV